MRSVVSCLLLLAAPACALLLPLPRAPPSTRPSLAAGAVAVRGVASSAAALLLPAAANAADAAPELPNDTIPVVIALVLLVATGALQLSLGDVMADEAQLPSSTSLINKNKQRRSTFIQGKKEFGDDFL